MDTTDPTPQAPTQVTPLPTDKLYNNLIKDGYTLKNLGTSSDFAKALSNPETSVKIYNGLRSDGYSEANLGDIKTFQNTFQSKKASGASSPQQSQDGGNGFRHPDLSAPMSKVDYSPYIQAQKQQSSQASQPITKHAPRLLTKQEDAQSFGNTVKIQQHAVDPNQPIRGAKSWDNLGDFVPNTVMSGLEKDAGNMATFLGGKMNPAAGAFLHQIGQGLDKYADEHQKITNQYQLPNTIGGGVATAATNIAPTLLELAVTPELDVSKVGKLGELLTKYGGKYAPKIAKMAGGKMPLQMGVNGLTSGYSSAKANGENDYDATKAGLVKSAKEYGTGLLFEGAGKLASKVSDLGAKAMEDAGWGKTTQAVGKTVLHSSAQAAAFSAVPFVTNALQGKSTSLDEFRNNAVFGGLLGLFHGGADKGEPTPADGAAKEVLQRSPLIDLYNFMSSDMDAVKAAHDSPATSADLQAKAAVHADNAFKADDPEEKQQEVVNSSLNGKLASVKAVTGAILGDKNAVVQSVQDLPVSDEYKQAMVDKINSVHKELDPVEQQKTAIGGQISQIDEALGHIRDADIQDPVQRAESEVATENLTKKREELNNNLKQLIINQQENGSQEKEESDQKGSMGEQPKGSAQKEEENAKNEQNEKRGNVETTGGDEPPVKEVTGIRNEDVSAEHEKENIPDKDRTHKTEVEIEAGGQKLLKSDEFNPNDFAKKIIEKPQPATAEEQEALLQHKTDLKNQKRKINKQIDNGEGDPIQHQINLAHINGLIDKNQQATEIIGNELGRSLGHRTESMNEDFSHNTVLRRAKLANGNQELSPKDKSNLEERTKRIEKLEGDLADREEQIRKLHENSLVDRVKRNSELEERNAKREITKSKLRQEREDIKAELISIARKSRGELGANKIPIELLDPMAKLARNYVLDGVVSISQVADKIYNDLKDHLDGIEKSDIESAIKDGFDKYLSEQNSNRLEKSKKRQAIKLEELKSGNYEKKVYAKIQVDNDYLKIQSEINREQLKINKHIDDIENSKKSIARKVTDFAVKYGRQAKLASVTVLGKLAASGLSTVGLKPITEAVGGVASKILPRIAEKSTVEGGTDFSGMAKAYAKAATQGMKDAYDEMNIKAGGKSDLSALYGKTGHLPAEAAEFFGHIHSAIKAPVKRFIWEQSYSKRIAKGMEAGIDITDPVIDARNRLAAYKDAERAIFMGDNALSEAYEGVIGRFEKADDSKSGLYLRKNFAALARILLPFVKVPTNIVLSSGRYALGLIPGLGKLAQVGAAESAKKLGAETIAKVLGNGFDGLTPEESDIILRNLKHGSVGGAALALGFFNPKNIGGYYQPNEKRKHSDVDADQFKIFGQKIPMWMTEHPIFQAMQIGATYRRLLDTHIHKDDKIESSTLGTLSGISSNIPLAEEAKNIFDALGSSNKFNKFISNTVKGEIDPAIIQQLAQITDTKDGSIFSLKSQNQNKRSPNNKHGLGKYMKEDLETGLPILRENVKKKNTFSIK